jgi:hypothetical protein
LTVAYNTTRDGVIFEHVRHKAPLIMSLIVNRNYFLHFYAQQNRSEEIPLGKKIADAILTI